MCSKMRILRILTEELLFTERLTELNSRLVGAVRYLTGKDVYHGGQHRHRSCLFCSQIALPSVARKIEAQFVNWNDRIPKNLVTMRIMLHYILLSRHQTV